MNMTAETDIGPLTWVKGEIDLALERALDAFERHGAEGADSTHLKAARAHLHQAHGALSIVGLDGVTRFSEVAEELLEAVDQGRVEPGPAVADAVRKGIAAIRHYLDDLVAGQPDQALRLLPAYRALTMAAGLGEPTPADLFFPDVSRRPPKREREPAPLAEGEIKARARTARMAFQRGLLKWLKHDPCGIGEMWAAAAAVEATQTQPGARAFWWMATGFLDALAAGAVPIDTGVYRVCARIDLQMKRLIEGSRTVAERLMRDTLYYLAIARPGGDRAEAVKAAYRLGDLLPAPAASGIEPLRPVLRVCREQLAMAMEDWNRFCAGTVASLPQFHDRVRQMAGQAGELGHADLSRLAGAILATTDDLRRAPLSHTESLGIEMATALLLLDSALESFPRIGDEFGGQIDAVAARLDAAGRGEPLAAMAMPHLDEMSRRAQEKLLMAQVAKEILANLAVVEQTLDAFFRDPAKAGELSGLTKPIRQIQGALAVLGQERAGSVLRECEDAIAGFGAEGVERRQEDFEDVARKLSALGFFAERLQHGPADIDSYLSAPSAAPFEEEVPAPTAERELEETRRQTQALIGALREQPEDAALRDEIQHNLEALRESAELADDAMLVEQAEVAIEAIKGEHTTREIEQAFAALAPAEAPLHPSPEAARLAEASHEQVDSELLGIFIEEAREVLASIGDSLPKLADRPHDRDALTVVRRGFHTLKGSGRMVGLADLGEAAWAVEQVLNRWLQAEHEATAPLRQMLAQAHELFGGWVAQLDAGGGLHRDASALAAACEQLRAEPAPETRIAASPEEAAEAAPPEPPPPRAEEIVEAVTLELPAAPTEEAAETAAPPALRLVPPAAAPEEVHVGDLALPRTLYELYVTEAREHIATLQHELGIAGPPRPPLIRAAHTLGSISATTGIDSIHHLAHALEMALNRLDRAKTGPTEDQRFLLARSAGALEGMFGAVVQKRMPRNEAALTADLDALTPVVAAPEAAAEALPEAASPAETAVPAIEIPPPPASSYPLAEAADTERRHMRLADELDEQLLPIFLEDSTDLVREIGADLRAWREQPEDGAVAERLKRSLHTLKGNARMAGAMAIGELVHGMETRVDQALSMGGPTPAFLDAFDASFDRMSLLIEHLRGGEIPAEEPAKAPSPPIAVPTPAPAAGAPSPAPSRAAAQPPVRAAAERRPEAPEAEVAARTMLRVRADIVDKLVNEAGEIAIARGRIEGEMRSTKSALLDLTENVIRLRNQLREIEIQAETQMQSRQALAAEQSVQFDPLEFDRFTRFQELTRMMAESVNDVATSQHTLLQNLDHAAAALTAQARLNREHSQALMNVRMVPFGTLADRLYRIVRQTAKELDKRANLDIRGGQTELDRSVLEKMTGPIEHLLRNAVAHGLEAPAKRRAADKAEIGEISLRVAQEGNEIAIELADDGGGLDLERIRARGVEAGLLDAGATPSAEELAQLIFQAGFSTAEKLTSVAGRGVGMDVVKTEVTNLGGRIQVESTPGAGTRFRIHLPLTLAVTQAVLVKSGGRHYAIPAAMVAQVSELKPEAIATIRADGFAGWLGDAYPWRYLPRLFGAAGAAPEPARRHWLLLLRAGEQRLALEVDALAGNQEVVVKNIGPQLARVVGVAGATVLGDGEIVLILNPIALDGRPTRAVEAEGQAAAPAMPPEAAIAATPATGVVMVVDDSLTVRKITGRLLAREGYHVLSAKDGVDALEQLLDRVPDVMLVDIEMPRMDGFELTRNVRADARLKDVPIIMITSRIAEKHRNYARELGVDHYLGKPYDEDELLKLIAGYTKKSH